MHAMSQCFFGVGGRIYDNRHDYPERPNGGKWVGMGYSYPKDFDYGEIKKYNWSGERTNDLHNTLGVKKLTLTVFDTPFDGKERHYYETGHSRILKDDSLAQMLFIINERIDPRETGVDLLPFENIPNLTACGILNGENDKPAVDIPILTGGEFNELEQITRRVSDAFIPAALKIMRNHLLGTKIKLPAHLKSVPEQKQYLNSMNYLHTMTIYTAIERKLIFNEVDYPIPPMILIVEK